MHLLRNNCVSFEALVIKSWLNASINLSNNQKRCFVGLMAFLVALGAAVVYKLQIDFYRFLIIRIIAMAYAENYIDYMEYVEYMEYMEYTKYQSLSCLPIARVSCFLLLVSCLLRPLRTAHSTARCSGTVSAPAAVTASATRIES